MRRFFAVINPESILATRGLGIRFLSSPIKEVQAEADLGAWARMKRMFASIKPAAILATLGLGSRHFHGPTMEVWVEVDPEALACRLGYVVPNGPLFTINQIEKVVVIQAN